MPYQETLNLVAGEWIQITNADATSVSFQNQSGFDVLVVATETNLAPVNFTGSIKYKDGQGEINSPLADLWPGVSGVRVWAFSKAGGKIMVSHA